ncbi:MAG TPA: tetratricopeptide repeat protein [Gemmatimonadaceae bacterium]|nr:tetratricopeptide repeat protein [Gemmatimonadaceae bacterium]
MSQVARLKKQAADFELKRQFDKAIAVYVKLLESFDQHSAELDVALFNRVGDLMLRQGNVADAVDYYERAVDQYADTGFFNNAIALCNKILRYSPGRASVYYKLGRISAKKGFTNEARTNFLEYADRMQKAGNVDEAFRALTEFADLCPDQEEIRLMLAEQLTRAGRGDEAIEQYQVLYERCDRQGRRDDARHVLERMRAIDSSVEPRKVRHEEEDTDSGLIFLDLDDGAPSAAPPAPRATTSHRPAAPPRQFAPPPRIVPAPEPERRPEPKPEQELEPLDDALQEALEGITRIGDDVEPLEIISSDSLLGLEPTGLADESTMLGGFDGAGAATVDATDAYAVSDSPDQGSAQPSFEDEVPLDGLPFVTVESESALGADLDEDLLDDEPIVVPTPSVARRATVEAAHSVELLRARVEESPNDWRLHRDLAEVMLEAGERSEGIRELESAMSGAERSGDLDLAASIAEEIARLEPDVVKHHQKRVEYAFRTNDRARLIEAYVALADVLFRSDQADKARTIYQRVLDLAPDEPRARAGLDALTRGSGEVDAFPTTTPTVDHAPVLSEPREKPTAPKASWGASRGSAPTNGFVDLGAWLRETEAPRDTRMVVPEEEPTGDEEADFADMLRKFKQGIAENVAVEDYQSHYDLAIAFKEMGLVDEAIAEFQKALGSPTNRLPTYEALGQCFLEKGQFKLASSILSRGLHENASEDQLVGILYWLGRAAELQNNPAEALGYYQRVFVLDIQFRDITDRMSAVERAWQ